MNCRYFALLHANAPATTRIHATTATAMGRSNSYTIFFFKKNCVIYT